MRLSDLFKSKRNPVSPLCGVGSLRTERPRIAWRALIYGHLYIIEQEAVVSSTDDEGDRDRAMTVKATETLSPGRKLGAKHSFRIVSPSDYFSALLNEEVVIRTFDGNEITGHLVGFDVNCNCVLTNAQEKVSGAAVAFYDRVLVNGQRIQFIHGAHEKHY